MTFLVFFGVVVALLVALEWATRPNTERRKWWTRNPK
jgi:hypothetical protein